MEKKVPQISLSEDEFIEFLLLARQNNKEATLRLIQHFEDDILYLSKFINMPSEDAIQSIKLELLKLIKHGSYGCITSD